MAAKLVKVIVNGVPKLARVVPDGTTAPDPLLPPENFQVVARDDGTADMTWNLPLSTGGNPITGFLVGRDGTDTAGYGPWEGERSATTFATTLTRLVHGATYNVYVATVTAGGTSAKAIKQIVIPPAPVNDSSSPLSFDPVPHAETDPLVFGHVMSNYYKSDNDKSFDLFLQGEIAADADRYAKDDTFTLRDAGKFWRVTSTGKCWVWNGTAWEDYGTMPAYTELNTAYRNPKDYQERHLLPPAIARSTTEQAYMGHDRDRVLPPGRHGGTKAEWMVANALTEVREWWTSGISVIGTHMPDLGDKPGSTGPQWDRAISYCDAIDKMNALDGTSMRYIPVGDGNTSCTRSVKNADGTINHKASGVAMGEKLLTLKDRKWLYKIGGKTVLAPFGPDLLGSVEERRIFWTAVIDTCEAGLMPIFFWPIFLKPWTDKTPSWNTIMDALGEWGPADPVSASSTGTRNKAMSQDAFAEIGVESCLSVRPADWRPRQTSFFEAGGADTMDETWRSALGGYGTTAPLVDPSSISFRPAAAVQLVTMNDIGEHSHIARSLNNGWVWLDYNRYWMQWFKKKAKPTITRDVIYVFHRWQFKDSTAYPMDFTQGLAPDGQVTPIIKQTVFVKSHSSNRTPVRNEIDIRVDLKEAATVIVSINGVDQTTHTGKPGRNAFKSPLKPGFISVRVVRNGLVVASVKCPREVVTKAPFEDLTYIPVSSTRPTL